nr:hypothetical protein [Tanacetum cinerariifolium]
MNPNVAKQVALDNALVAPEKRLKIEKLLNQDFVEPPSKEDLVPFIQELGYSGKLKESRVQILCGMYNKKDVDFVALLWEDFIFQADNQEITLARKEHMPYPRFMKVIINHFISKDKNISMRNMINLHIIRDDTLLGTSKFISKTQDYQQYGALIPDDMINQHIKDSKAYKTYLDFATGKATPKKARKLSPILEEEPVVKPKRAKRPAKKSTTMPTVCVIIRDTPSESMSKKKTQAKVDTGKGMDLLSNVALLKATQLKKTLKKSKLETHKLHASGSGDGFGSQPKVPNEQEDKTRDSGDDDSNDNYGDEVTKDDNVDSDADSGKEASDSEKIDSDEDENTNLNQNDDGKKNMKKSMYVLLIALNSLMMKKNMRNSTRTKYEQVKDDEHVILTTVHDTQKTKVPLQSSSVSSDFANPF